MSEWHIQREIVTLRERAARVEDALTGYVGLEEQCRALRDIGRMLYRTGTEVAAHFAPDDERE